MPYKEQEDFELSEREYITAFSRFILVLEDVCCAFIWICAFGFSIKLSTINILFFTPLCILAIIATLGCLYIFSYIVAKIEEKAIKIRQTKLNRN